MTNEQNKREAVTMLIESYFKKKKIVFYDRFFNAEYQYCLVDNIEKECVSQLRNFNQKRVITNGKDGTPKCEIFYSGKHGGKNDDFVMALLIGIYNHRVFFKSEKYRYYR
jgi:hypothetical protein